MIPWQDVFSQISQKAATDASITSLPDLKRFLDIVHIRDCLVRPYQEQAAYPIVEPRELLPSFDTDMMEYKDLPAFALVAFGRKLDYFSEIFQFDKLHSPKTGNADCCPLENLVIEQNIQTLASRLPKRLQQGLRAEFRDRDPTTPENYAQLLPYLLNMDRAQVFSLDEAGIFHLAGIFASFPSDIDSELKRFGLRIGKFVYGDSEMYERNRMFVYQFLMELYGFPVVSERRTSSALFARKLHKMGENFLLRVLGQTDRTLTTYFSDGENRRYPRIEKVALVAVSRDQQEACAAISRKGFFLDPEKRVVIMRATYRQHRYDPDNLRQDRALSVATQEIIHPLTGEILTGLNIIKDSTSIFLRLNDIVRGEYTGRIVYKRVEVVENTDTDEKILKFLYHWLAKHQRRMISYNDEFFLNVSKVINGYLQSPAKAEAFDAVRELYQEVTASLAYIQQARRARALQDIARRKLKGVCITYKRMCAEAVALLTELQFEMVNFFPELARAIVKSVDIILRDRYLIRHYIEPAENTLTSSGLEIRKNYGKLVALQDSIKAVCKSHLACETVSEVSVA